MAEAEANRLSVGRGEILWGERLRRARRRGEARAHLQWALDVLRTIGATAFVERGPPSSSGPPAGWWATNLPHTSA